MSVQRSIVFLFLLGGVLAAGFLLRKADDSLVDDDLVATLSAELAFEEVDEREVDPDIFDYQPLESSPEEVDPSESVMIDFLSRLIYPHESLDIAYLSSEKARREMLFVPSKTFEVKGSENDFANPGVPTVSQDGIQIISNFPQDRTLSPFETADYKTTEPGFYIDRKAVTNREYRQFLKATGRPAPKHWNETNMRSSIKDDPIVNITYDEASAYASWAGKRLPTVSEMERAIRKSASLRLGAPLNEWTSTPAKKINGTISHYRFGGSPAADNERDFYTGFRLVQDEE